jgi:MraZ protein
MTDMPFKSAYTNTFEHLLDAKGRLTVPSEWRSAAHEKRFHVMPPAKGECLKVYPDSFLSEKLAQLQGVPHNDPRRRLLQDLARHIQTVDLDPQGRIMIQEKFRKGAGLAKKVVVSGCLDHFEVWDAESYGRRELAQPDLDAVMGEVGL